MTSYRRTEEELRQAAEAQFQALKISADHFDLGQIGEASRIANALFILIGEGMRTHTSILDAAGMKERVQFRSTKPAGQHRGCSLVALKVKKVADDEWECGLAYAGRKALEDGRDLSFAEWWQEVIIDNDEMRLNRSEVIRILRDKVGGAHFDIEITNEKAAMAIRGELGLFKYKASNGDMITVPHGLEYCVRQIATEFWFSFAENKSFDIEYSNSCAPDGDPRF